MKNLYFTAILFIIILLSGSYLLAQVPLPDPVGNEKNIIIVPPPVQVRTMAEWEEVDALVIAWESDEEILLEIVRHAVKECKVYIVTDNETGVRGQILQAGIFTPDRIEIIPYAANTVWMRDYGPWSVYHNDVGTLAFSDFTYNRLHRLKDDLAPYELAAYLAIPIYNVDESPFQWIHTGGNFLRDGMGTAYSSDLILRENSGKTGLEIKSFASTFFGINDYRILHRVPYDTIHHLDMHIRTLDEETLAVGWYPEGVADGPQIEANLDYIRQHFRTPFGRPYRIIRQQMPPDNGHYPPLGKYRTYTNGVFINKTFLVPTYEEQYDSIALNIYREHLPGYKVVGIDCNSIIHKIGALHCITKLIGVKEPLRISHPRLRDTYDEQEDYLVEAWVQHISGIDSVFLHYRLSGDLVYDSLIMTQGSGDLDYWQASIPAQAAGTEIQYYIAAYAASGKKQVRPLPAPEAYYPFKVKAYEQSPRAQWLQSLTTAAPDMSIRFTNDTEHGMTALTWSFPGGTPAASSEQDVFVRYPEAGNYPVRLIAKNPMGEDTLLLDNAVVVKTAYAPFIEDFENGLSPKWTTEGAINWIPWEEDCHQISLQLPHRLSAVDLNRTYLSTALNLNSLAFTALTFDVAYAIRDSAYFDELRVNIIDENGARHNIYNKGGYVLATIEAPSPDFNPVGCEQWRNETIDLREWEGQQVLLEFESIGDRGNNIYLDNIAIRANALPSVNVIKPEDGTFYTGNGQPILDTILVEAIDPDGSIEKVSFYVNTQFEGDDYEAPYELIYPIQAYGQYCYQVKARDDEGLQVWAQQICVQYDQNTAAEVLTEEGISWTISPNPVKDVLSLSVNSPTVFSDVLLTVMDIQGKLIQQQQQQFFAGDFQYPIPVKNLPAGNYVLHIQSKNLNKVLTFVKQ